MNINEAMKQLILGKCVGRYTVPGMKLKVVTKKECPGLSDKELNKLAGTAVVDISIVTEDGMNTQCDGEFFPGVYSFKVTYSEMNAEDYYVYSDTENLTTEQAYSLAMEGKKVYNDLVFPKDFYLSIHEDKDGDKRPALYYPTGQIVYAEDGSPWWTPINSMEFENHYYVKE